MKTKHILPAVVILFSSAVAMAHTGAQGVVLERMQGMTALADAMKSLAPIVRGEVAHDPQIVDAAGGVIVMHTGAGLVDLFVQGTDAAPSEAGPAIWDDPDGFAALSDELAALGDALQDAAASSDETKALFAQIGQTCRDCHEDYRVERD